MWTDHYVSRGWGLGNFQKYSCIAKTVKRKSCKGSHGENNRASAPTIIILIFYVKTIIAQAIAHQNIMHNLKVRKNVSGPRKLSTPNPFNKNNGASPYVVNTISDWALYFILGGIKTNEILTDMIAK